LVPKAEPPVSSAGRIAATLERLLGPQGRLISRSKSGYLDETHRSHLVIFNAQISVDGESVYHGDLDLSVDEPLLQAAALEVGEFYVLTEHEDDFKPGQPDSGRHFVYWTDGSDRRLGDHYRRHFGWAEGVLRRRPPER
jgi:hypothetical protein